MKKLTKKQRAEYPAYIVELDLLRAAADEKFDGKGLLQKAAESRDLLEVMKKVEACIKIHWKDIYLVNIYGQTGEETEYGEPLYDIAIMTRVRKDCYEDKAAKSSWHFKTKENSESPNPAPSVWYPSPDAERRAARHGILEYYSR